MDELYLILTGASAVIAITCIILVCLMHRKYKTRLDLWMTKATTAENAAVVVTQQLREDNRITLDLKLKKLEQAFDIVNTDIISQAALDANCKVVRQSLKTSLEQKFNRMSQEFLGNVNDEAQGLLTDLNFELCEKIWDSFQNFKLKVKDSPIILPTNAKLIYTKGNRTVVIIEQGPQVRSVSFSGALLGDKVAAAAQARTKNGYRFSLAFPFVYFVIVFDNGRFVSQAPYFRNKALTSVREHIYPAPLPNMHDSENMCMGSDGFSNAVNEEITIARQCDMIVSNFWQRSFNKDLGGGEAHKVDNRIKNYAVWQKNSLANPLFILDVDWQKGKTVKGVVESLLEQRARRDQLDEVDQHIRHLLECGVSRLTGKINEAINEAKTGHMLKSEVMESEVTQLLEKTLLDHAKKVFGYCAKNRS